MENYYNYFIRPWIGSVPPADETKLSALSYRVKIAILDTGFDKHDPYLEACRNRIKDSRSWIGGRNDIEDEAGRGTHSLALLLQVAPRSDIYVARIARSNDPASSHDLSSTDAIVEVSYNVPWLVA